MDRNLSNLTDGCSWDCNEEKPNSTAANSQQNPELSDATVILLSVVAVTATVGGSLGNSLVLLAVFRNRRLRSIPDLFISSLALSDLAVCSIYIPMLIYSYYHYADEAALKTVHYKTAKSFLGYLSLTASVTNILSVTVDRVIAIRLPLKYPAIMTVRKAVNIIVFVWLISLTCGVVHARITISRFYALAYCIFSLVCTLSMYVYIFISARRQENKVNAHHASFERSAARQKIEKKAAKTIFVVVGLYVLCWLPFVFLPVIVNPSTKMRQFKRVFPFVQTILACNSSLNPYVYCVRSQKYRHEFAKILGVERFMDRPLNSSTVVP